MNNNILTEKQTKVLESIKNYIKEHEISPTIRELCEINNVSSTQTIHEYLQKLKEKGYISYIEHSGRSIKLLKKGEKSKWKGKI